MSKATALSLLVYCCLQLDESMEVIKRYDSIADAVRETGINSKSIRDAANGVQKRAGGYIWRYEDTL